MGQKILNLSTSNKTDGLCESPAFFVFAELPFPQPQTKVKSKRMYTTEFSVGTLLSHGTGFW